MSSYICDYVQLADLTGYLFRDQTATAVDQAQMSLDITAASRAVDQFCNRRFGLVPGAVQRLYTWHGETVDGQQAVAIDDLMTTVGLVVTADTTATYTYSTTLAINVDFDLFPYNAIADGVPFTHIVRRSTSTQPWPAPQDRQRAFSVTASWGWSSIPSTVEIATLIQASRFFVRRDSQYGVAGSPALGNELRLQSMLDPDVRVALQSVVRPWGAA